MCSVIKFPKAKKRGPKVSRGPLGDVIRFPLLQGDELTALWVWLQANHKEWDQHETIGHDPDWRAKLPMALAMGLAMSGAWPTEATMRADVAKWQAHIQRRKLIDTWLAALGQDGTRSPEEALFFVHDSLVSLSPGRAS